MSIQYIACNICGGPINGHTHDMNLLTRDDTEDQQVSRKEWLERRVSEMEVEIGMVMIERDEARAKLTEWQEVAGTVDPKRDPSVWECLPKGLYDKLICERDEARAEVERLKKRGDHWQAVADAAENDNARLREALQKIDVLCQLTCVSFEYQSFRATHAKHSPKEETK